MLFNFSSPSAFNSTPLLQASFSTTANHPARLRLLVCIASVHPPGGKSTLSLDIILGELLDKYQPHFNVTVLLDTNSEELFAHVKASPAHAMVVTRVCPGKSCEWLMYLPFYHRGYIEGVLGDYDHFLYVEDDILVPLPAFQLYLERYQELWSHGWLFGWVRTEQWRGSNQSVANDTPFPLVDAIVYKAPHSGALYAEPWGAYSACYALDANQVRIMMGDPSKVWESGFPGLPERERIGVGYNFVFDGGNWEARKPTHPLLTYWAKGWRGRALVPLKSNGQVDPITMVKHLTSKYSDAAPSLFSGVWCSVPLEGMFLWSSNSSFKTLPLPVINVCGEGEANRFCCLGKESKNRNRDWSEKDLPGDCSKS
jgi:hypothetical protein